jgi:hypothetical protein
MAYYYMEPNCGEQLTHKLSNDQIPISTTKSPCRASKPMACHQLKTSRDLIFCQSVGSTWLLGEANRGATPGHPPAMPELPCPCNSKYEIPIERLNIAACSSRNYFQHW